MREAGDRRRFGVDGDGGMTLCAQRLGVRGAERSVAHDGDIVLAPIPPCSGQLHACEQTGQACSGRLRRKRADERFRAQRKELSGDFLRPGQADFRRFQERGRIAAMGADGMAQDGSLGEQPEQLAGHERREVKHGTRRYPDPLRVGTGQAEHAVEIGPARQHPGHQRLLAPHHVPGLFLLHAGNDMDFDPAVPRRRALERRFAEGRARRTGVACFDPTLPRPDHAAGDNRSRAPRCEPRPDEIQEHRLESVAAEPSHAMVRGGPGEHALRRHGPNPQTRRPPVDTDPPGAPSRNAHPFTAMRPRLPSTIWRRYPGAYGGCLFDIGTPPLRNVQMSTKSGQLHFRCSALAVANPLRDGLCWSLGERRNEANDARRKRHPHPAADPPRGEDGRDGGPLRELVPPELLRGQVPHRPRLPGHPGDPRLRGGAGRALRPERERASRAAGRGGLLPAGGGDPRHRGAGGRDRGEGAVDAARHRERGGGPHRPRRGPRGGDGPLHEDRVRAPLRRPQLRRGQHPKVVSAKRPLHVPY